MKKRLFVGNLPDEVTEGKLKEIFEAAGKVEGSVVILDKFSGKSKGFGFVEMGSEEEAKKAIEMFNNSQLGDRKLRVDFAYPPKKKPFFKRKSRK